jgi:spore maturation protein SpmA
MPKPTQLSSGASKARIMFLSLPLFFGGCAVIAYGLRRAFALEQPMSVYLAALPALAISLLFSAVIVRLQARRRAAKAARRTL